MTIPFDNVKQALHKLDFDQLKSRLDLIDVSIGLADLLTSVPEITEYIEQIDTALSKSASIIVRQLGKHGERGEALIAAFKTKHPLISYRSFAGNGIDEIQHVENMAHEMAKTEGIEFSEALVKIGKTRAAMEFSTAPAMKTSAHETQITKITEEANKLVRSQGISFGEASHKIGTTLSAFQQYRGKNG